MDNEIKLTSKYRFILIILSIHFVMYMLINGFMVTYFLAGNTFNDFHTKILIHFKLPSNFNNFLHHPHTLITSLFYTDSYFLLLRNSLIFLGLSLIIKQVIEDKQLMRYYIIFCFFGNLFYVILYFLALHFINQYPIFFAHKFNNFGFSLILLVLINLYKQPKLILFDKIYNGVYLWKLLAVYILIDVLILNQISIIYILNIIISVGLLWIVRNNKYLKIQH